MTAGETQEATLPRIVPATAHHAQVLAEMMKASFPADSGERWRDEDLALSLTLTGAFGFCAVAGDAPLGFALARAVADEAELLLMGVIPQAQGRGIGYSLLKAVATEARLRDCEKLFLEVRQGNASARRLYTRFGFEQAGVRKCYYRGLNKSESAITMRIFISSCPIG